VNNRRDCTTRAIAKNKTFPLILSKKGRPVARGEEGGSGVTRSTERTNAREARPNKSGQGKGGGQSNITKKKKKKLGRRVNIQRGGLKERTEDERKRETGSEHGNQSVEETGAKGEKKTKTGGRGFFGKGGGQKAKR